MALSSMMAVSDGSRPERLLRALRINCAVVAWAGGAASAIGTVFVMVATTDTDNDVSLAIRTVLAGAGFGVGPLLGLIAAAGGVGGGILAFRNGYLAVATLVVASVVEFFAIALGGGRALPVGVVTFGALALLMGATALAGVSLVVAKVRPSGSLGTGAPITD